MGHTEWLDECIGLFEAEAPRQRRRVLELDWDAELERMLDDEEYSALDRSYMPKDWTERTNAIRLELTGNSTVDLRDHLLKAEQKAREVANIQRDALKAEYQKRDADLMPTLTCSHCARFFVTQKQCGDHTCDGTTKCNNCGQNCRTKERLEAHIRQRKCAKAHECKECSFETNSEAIWTKHTKSKEHREKAGIVKAIHECSACEYTTSFDSKFKEHCLTKRHKKLCSI